MQTLIKNISSLVTVRADGARVKAGAEMQNIGEIRNGAFLFSDKIEWIGTTQEAEKLISERKLLPDTIIDAGGKTVLPGFADSHTHIVFAGNRSDEFAMRLRGATYQEIALAGGGILATVKATRTASLEQLVEKSRKLAWTAIRHGTTALEIKSGYGLDTATELKMLRAIQLLKLELPVYVKTTFLGAHDFPPEYSGNRDKYVDLICNEMLPAVAEEHLADYCDAFVDKGYFTIEQGKKIFNRAKELGLKIKVHADELTNVSAGELAGRMGAVSADHLLFASDASISAMKSAGTIATLLPGTAYFIRMPYAPARKMIENGMAVALATDCNPGSCFTENMQLILSLAVINMRMTAEEALTAATLNGAAAIEISDKTGSIEVGKNADFLIADVSSYTDLFYHFGINQISEVWVRGENVILNPSLRG